MITIVRKATKNKYVKIMIITFLNKFVMSAMPRGAGGFSRPFKKSTTTDAAPDHRAMSRLRNRHGRHAKGLTCRRTKLRNCTTDA